MFLGQCHQDRKYCHSSDFWVNSEKLIDYIYYSFERHDNFIFSDAAQIASSQQAERTKEKTNSAETH